MGGFIYAVSLAPYIDSNIPIYVLPFELTEDASRRTIEGIASRMVELIRATQPSGPYRIAGYSFGGVLAYEIATQLIGADQQVAFVGLLDGPYYSHFSHVQSQGTKNNTYSSEISCLLMFVKVKGEPNRRSIMNDINSIAAAGEFSMLKNSEMSTVIRPSRTLCGSYARTVAARRSFVFTAFCCCPRLLRTPASSNNSSVSFGRRGT